MATILDSINLFLVLDTVTDTIKEIRLNQYNQQSYHLVVLITDQGYQKTLTENENSCTLRIETPDNQLFLYKGTINPNGTVSFILPQQLSWSAGQGSGWIVIGSKSSMETITTQRFIVNIKPSAYEDGVVIDSDDFKMFSNFVATSQELREEIRNNAELAQESAQSAAQSALSAADSAEVALMISIPDGSIVTSRLAEKAVATDKIADYAVTSEKMAMYSVTSGALADFAVTEDKMAHSAVNTIHLIDEAVTTAKIADASITKAKLSSGSVSKDKLDDELFNYIKTSYVSPEMYGAIGDGQADDTTAMMNTFANGRLIVFTPGKTYKIGAPIIIYEGTTVDLNGATLTGIDNDDGNHLIHNFLSTGVYTGYDGFGSIVIKNGTIQKGSIDLCHGRNILVENVYFRDCTRDHYFEICACKNVTIKNCIFSGMSSRNTSTKEYINIDNCTYGNFPWFSSSTSESYDGTIVDSLTVDSCIFERSETSMEDAVGKHSYYDNNNPTDKPAKNITIRNCKVYKASNTAFLMKGVSNLIIEDCYIENCYRAFDLRNVFSAKIDGNNIKGCTKYNYISYCDDVNYTNNYNVLPSDRDTHDVFVTGKSTYFNYSNNYFRNSAGTSMPITFAPSLLGSGEVGCQSSTFMKILNNNYSILDSNCKSTIHPLTATGKTLTFSHVEDLNFAGAISAATAVNKAYDLTQFNRLVLQMGQIGNQTYCEVVIKSFHDRNFQVGESYRYTYIAQDGTVSVGTITITNTYTITATGLSIRNVICQKIPRD